jgi:uncharacterized protein
MKTYNASRQTIDNFLAQKRIAMVGISHDSHDFSVALFKELCRRGYDVVPVNPYIPQVDGRECFAHVWDIFPPVEGALLMTSPDVTNEIVRDCAEAGIRRVWMYQARGQGAVSGNALAFCWENGIEAVAGECPFMYLGHPGAIHALHGFVRKITGNYPRRQAA